jgi:hypothetical protein
LFWIFLFHGHRGLLGGVDKGEGDAKHKEDNK